MSETTTTTAPPPRATRGPGTSQLLIVVAILAAGIALTALTADVTRVSEPGIRLVGDQPYLPETAGDWRGGEQTGLTKEERDVLPADTEGTRRIYTDGKGHSVYCSVVLAGRDVTSIHRPELCLTGQGWRLDAPRLETIETAAAAGGRLAVTRLNSANTVRSGTGQSGQVYSVFVYWFVGKDRTTPHHWQRILWTTQDRVFHNRNHRWAYFLINTLVPPEQARDPAAGQDAAMQVIRQFIATIYPALTHP
jgi:EpsI family protein